MGKQTPLFLWHQSNNGKLVDFSGWDMPVNYGSQIEEHNAVRQSAGMFDVSHMTVVDISGEDAKAYLQYLLANNVAHLDGYCGKALYSGMLNEAGGVIDDLIVYNMSSKNETQWYRTVVNCGTRDKDLMWMQRQAASFKVNVTERADLAMLAVQGPEAIRKYSQVIDAADQKTIAALDVFQGTVVGERFCARTGYTGEDGLEIILPAAELEPVWMALVDVGVKPCGLGARDTLRLEAGMNLYGHEMDDNVSPLAANMAWTIAWEPNERVFIGRDALVEYQATRHETKLVGLVMRDKGVLRAHQKVVVRNDEDEIVEGEVTSGTFSPTLGYSIALARVPNIIGSQCQIEMRKKLITVDVVKPCFVRNGQSLL